jgi:hypothetical protein
VIDDVGESRVLGEALLDGVARGDVDGGGDSVAVACPLSSDDGEGVGEAVAEARTVEHSLPLGDSVGGTMVPDAAAEALVETTALADAAGAVGEVPPLPEAGLLAEGDPLKVGSLLVEEAEMVGGAVRDSELPPREGVPLPVAHGERLAAGVCVTEPLAKAVALASRDSERAPLALAQLVLVGASTEGDAEDDAVPALLLVGGAEAENDARPLHDGAAPVAVPHAVGGADAAGEADAV